MALLLPRGVRFSTSPHRCPAASPVSSTPQRFLPSRHARPWPSSSLQLLALRNILWRNQPGIAQLEAATAPPDVTSAREIKGPCSWWRRPAAEEAGARGRRRYNGLEGDGLDQEDTSVGAGRRLQGRVDF
jgi:hypothetical protein